MMGVFINYKSFWVRDFINAVLLVVIHILYTQKWAIGHTQCLALQRVHGHLQIVKV